MTHSRAQLFSTHRRTLAALMFGLAFSAVVAYATPPGSAYTPAETLDPICVPGSAFCTVDISAGSLIGSTSTNGTETWLGTSVAGLGAASTDHTVFIGIDAGISANDSEYSNFMGYQAGAGSTTTHSSTFIGTNAGYQVSNASNAVFIGSESGSTVTNAGGSNFIGYQAGLNAINATTSNLIGYQAGLNSFSVAVANVIGNGAGSGATAAPFVNFIGNNAGFNSSDTSSSTFIGYNTGGNATHAQHSVFIGTQTGANSTGATNGIFLGREAGLNDTVDNTTDQDDYSILIGLRAGTGGFENSIAIGAYATNTALNQFMIGSATRPINEMVITGTGGQSCTIRPDTAGINCSSDQTLKTNITDLENVLDTLSDVRTVMYNWKNTPNTNAQIGFLAQDLKEYFPTLVSRASNGYLQVNYAGMTPILTKAIQELNLKVEGAFDIQKNNTFAGNMRAWFANTSNGIAKMFAGEVETKNLCVSDDTGERTCITKSDLDALLENAHLTPSSPEPVPTPEIPVVQDEPVDPVPTEDATEPMVDSTIDTPPTHNE